MHKLALFCKSYDRDMLRARRMADSVRRFNRDAVPLYLSVPEKDLAAFQQCFGDISCTFLTDEEILAKSRQAQGELPALYPSHLLQQLIKLEFWQLSLCENYAWIDSDAYFLRDFHVSDFMFDDKTPYFIEDEYDRDRELARLAAAGVPKKLREKRVNENLSMIDKFRTLFDNRGPVCLYSGTMPYIWSVLVLRHLNEEFLRSCGKGLYELLYEFPCETQLYGEYLRYSKVIPIRPRPNMFRCILYPEDFYLMQMQGENEYSLAKDYFGLCIQSNWTTVRRKKTNIERLKKHFQQFQRTLGLLSFAGKRE